MKKGSKSEVQAGIKSLLTKRENSSQEKLSQEDKRLNRVLVTVEKEVKAYADFQLSHINKLAKIGLALSGEGDMMKLLEMIVDAARELSMADAGTLYILDKDNRRLTFEILQNDTMKTRMGGTTGNEITLPPVPLDVDGRPNHSNVSSYVALTGETVNIPDVYEAEGFDFTGPRKYDEATGYRSRSMLVIPMRNHEDDIIGVLQLLNAIDLDTGEVSAFSTEYVDLIGSLASQAAVALTNAQLIRDLKNLLYSFIKSIAAAIDEKSAYTGGHFDRVVELTMMIAEKINEAKDGPFADVSFTEDELEELRVAAWMHDVGKITTPEYVVDKRTKLETIYDGIELVNARFGMIEKIIETYYLEDKIKLMEKGNVDQKKLKELDDKFKKELKEIEDDMEFIAACNTPREFMDDGKLERMKKIARKKYKLKGKAFSYLTDEEVAYLSIRKGNLTDEERKTIENHALLTKKMLEQLPFPKKLARVPEYASAHHEKLDGSGYPSGLTADELSLQARIMAVADVFEALTARDRPYKKPMKLSQAVKILGFMKKDQHIDPDIYDFFISSKLYKEYAEKELNPDQIDEVEV